MITDKTDILFTIKEENYIRFIIWSRKMGYLHYTEAFCSDDYDSNGNLKLLSLIQKP